MPPGSAAPDWLNTNELNQLYDYYSFKNNNEPWFMWKPWTEDDDPANDILKQWQDPPENLLLDGERQPQQQAQPTSGGTLSDQQAAGLDALTRMAQRFGVDPNYVYDNAQIATEGGGRLSVQDYLFAGGTGALAGAIPYSGPGGVIGGTAIALAFAALADNVPGLREPLMKFGTFMDTGAEATERGLGFLYQLLQDPGATLANPNAAWEAAGMAYEIYGGTHNFGINLLAPANMRSGIGQGLQSAGLGNLAAGSEYLLENVPMLGGLDQYTKPQPWMLDVIEEVNKEMAARLGKYAGMENAGDAMLQDIRSQIASGKSLDQIRAEYAPIVGEVGYTGEMIGHMILDPLNIFGPIVVGSLKAGTKAFTTAANAAGQPYSPKIWLKALDAAEGPNDALRKYAVLLRQELNTQAKVDAATGFTRFMARVDRQGNPKKGWWIFGLTPASRANETLTKSADNLRLLLSEAQSVDDIYAIVRGLAGTNPEDAARLFENSPWITGVDGKLLPLAMKDYKGLDELAATWHSSRDNATIITRLGALLDITPHEFIRRAGSGDGEKLLAELRTALASNTSQEARALADTIANTTADKLHSIGRTFTTDGVALTLDEFKGQLFASIMEHTGGWAARYFGVKPDPKWVRFSNTVKAYQSYILLGMNPTYVLNNVLDNWTTMAWSGVFGLRNQGQINNFWGRWGGAPERLQAGVGGMAGMGDAGIGTAIRAAQQLDTPDMLAKMDKFIKSKGMQKLQFATKLSQAAEQMASAQAYTVGTEKAFTRLWKPGKGFERLPRALEMQLAQIDQRLPQLIYTAIQSGINRKEIEAALWSGTTRTTIEDVLPSVAEELTRAGLPMSADDVSDMLISAGVWDYMKAGLANAQTDDQIRAVLYDTRRMVEARIDEMIRANNKEIAKRAAGMVANNGGQEALLTFSGLMDDAYNFHLQSWADWEFIFTRAEGMNRKQKSALIKLQQQRNREEWTRMNSYNTATMAGVFEGLGSTPAQTQLLYANMQAINDIWGNFYVQKERLLSEYWDNWDKFTREENSARWRETFQKQKELHAAAIDAEKEMQDGIDDVFASLFDIQFGGGQAAALRWREGVAKVRERMSKEITKFYEELQKLPADERHAAWQKFLNETYFKSMQERLDANLSEPLKMLSTTADQARQTKLIRKTRREFKAELQRGGIGLSNTDWRGTFRRLNRYLDPSDPRFTEMDYLVTPTETSLARLRKAIDRYNDARGQTRRPRPEPTEPEGQAIPTDGEAAQVPTHKVTLGNVTQDAWAAAMDQFGYKSKTHALRSVNKRLGRTYQTIEDVPWSEVEVAGNTRIGEQQHPAAEDAAAQYNAAQKIRFTTVDKGEIEINGDQVKDLMRQQLVLLEAWSPDEIAAITSLWDARAAVWAMEHNSTPANWYATHWAGAVDGVPGINDRAAQGYKGAVTFKEDGRAIFHALNSPDVSTLVHETAHVFFSDLSEAGQQTFVDWIRKDFANIIQPEDIRIEDGKIIGEAKEVTYLGATYKTVDEFAKEMFARGFERYTREGIAPTAGLRQLFEKFKGWLRAIYKSVKGEDIEIPISNQMRQLFDGLLTEETPRLRMATDPIYGRPTYLYLPESKTKYQMRYALVELDEIIPSQTDLLAENPKYPPELQPRDRTKFATKQWLVDKSRPDVFNEDLLLMDAPIADQGTPIIGIDGFAESGNKRVLLLRRIAAETPALYDRYIKAIEEQLEAFGLTKEQLAGFENPVLVRISEADYDRVEFANYANKPSAEVMSSAEVALLDAKLISNEAMKNFDIADTETVDDAIYALKNADFVRSMLGQLTDNERAELIDADGKLNKRGKDRIKLAILAKTYKGDVGARLLAALESQDPIISSFERAIYQSLGKVSQAEAMIDGGLRAAGLSITSDILTAMETIRHIRSAGDMSIDDWLRQSKSFGDTPQSVMALVQLLSDYQAKPTVLRDFLKSWAEQVIAEPQEGQLYFGSMSKSKVEILNDAAKVATREDRYLFGQSTLFQRADVLSDDQFANYTKALARQLARTDYDTIEGRITQARRALMDEPSLPRRWQLFKELERTSPDVADAIRKEAQSRLAAGQMIDANDAATVRSPLFQRDSRVTGQNWYYSQIEKLIESKMPAKASGQQILGMVRGLVKADELKWTGFEEWLQEQQGPVTKEQALQFIRANQVEIVDVGYANADDIKYPGFETSPVIALSSEGPIMGAGSEIDVMRMAEVSGYKPEEIQIVRNPDYRFITGTKYQQYIMPGVKADYRELLLTIPTKGSYNSELAKFIEYLLDKYGEGYYNFWSYQDSKKYHALEEAEEINRTSYISPHWDQQNVVAHVRFDTRITGDGKQLLFIEEIQSDWHQAGREQGYRLDMQSLQNERKRYFDLAEELRKQLRDMFYEDPKTIASPSEEVVILTRKLEEYNKKVADIGGEIDKQMSAVPAAPFATSWPELTFKRMIRWAAENGYDQVAWTPGSVQTDRYNLAKVVQHIAWEINDDGTYNLTAPLLNGSAPIYKEDLTIAEVKELVGKEITDKILAGEGRPDTDSPYRDWHILEGEDLKVGGHGMVAFYDQMIPAIVSKLIKKWGAKIEDVSISVGNRRAVQIDLAEARERMANRERLWVAHKSDLSRQLPVVSPIVLDNLGPERVVLRLVDQPITVQSFMVTPEMRASAMEGLPLFQRKADPANSPTFFDAEDTPLFSQTAQRGTMDQFNPQAEPSKQLSFMDDAAEIAKGSRYLSIRIIGPGINDTIKLALGDIDSLLKLKNANPDAEFSWKVQDDQGVVFKSGKKIQDLLPDVPKDQLALFQRGQTKTPEFLRWFGASKVVDQNGDPLILYHGTLYNFRTFKPGSAQGYWGDGYYFTNNTDDASLYANIAGPDWDNKLIGMIDQIEDGLSQEPYVYFEDLAKILNVKPSTIEKWSESGKLDAKLTDDVKTKLARIYLETQNEGLVMPVYLSLQKPLDMTRAATERLEWITDVDEAGDIINESGSAIDFINTIQDVAADYDLDVSNILENLLPDEIDGMRVADAFEKLRELSQDLETEYGADYIMFGNQFSQEVAARMGYDGVIMDAWQSFGPRNIMGGRVQINAMPGIDENTRHYVAFYPTQIKSAIGNRGSFDPESSNILFQRSVEKLTPQLVAYHNLNADKLYGADELGGLPIPSIAIKLPGQEFTSFGDITMIARRQTIDPRIDRRNAIFDADAYTPRRPRFVYKPVKAAIYNRMTKDWRDFAWEFGDKVVGENVGEYVQRGSFENAYDEMTRRSAGVIAYYLKANKVNIEKLEPLSEYDSWAMKMEKLRAANELLDYNGLRPQFMRWAYDHLRTIFGSKMIEYKGKKVEFTLENVVAAMTRRNPRAGEDGTIGGHGVTRAVMTRRFASIKEVKKAANAIVDAKTFNEYKSAGEAEILFNEFSNAVYNSMPQHGFGYYNRADEVLLEAARSGQLTAAGIKRQAESWGYKIDDVGAEAGAQYLKVLREAPTEFFEAKPQRAVGFDEWAGAVIPTTADPKVVEILQRRGVQYKTYDPAIAGSRQAAVESFYNQPDVLFQRTRTDTPEFEEWFGDSKVVDDQGRPKIMYRGDRPGKTIFGQDQDAYITGNIFFTDNPRVAKFYTGYRTKIRDVETLADADGLYRVYLSIRNPLIIDAKGSGWADIPNPFGENQQIDRVAQLAKQNGYDGLIVRNMMDQAGPDNQYVVFEPTQIKSVFNQGSFDPGNPDILFQRQAADQGEDWYYSQLRRTIAERMPNKATPQQVMGMIRGLVKADELKWTAFDDWLNEQTGPITKQQALDYLDQNAVRVETVVRGEPDPIAQKAKYDLMNEEIRLMELRKENWDAIKAIFGEYKDTAGVYEAIDKLARGEVTKLISDNVPQELIDAHRGIYWKIEDIRHQYQEAREMARPTPTRWQGITLPGGQDYREILFTLPHQRAIERLYGQDYANWQHSHWNDTPNVLAHTRFDTRTIDGRKTMFVQEIQSDLHQIGQRRGYRPIQENIIDFSRIEFTVTSLTGGENNYFYWKIPNDYGSWHAGITKHMIQPTIKDKIPTVVFTDTLLKGEKLVLMAKPHGITLVTDNGTDTYMYFKNEQDALDAIEIYKQYLKNPEYDYLLSISAPGGKTNSHKPFKTLEEAKQVGEEWIKNQYRKDANTYNSHTPYQAPLANEWPVMVLKRLTRYAAENGFERVALPTGPTAAKVEGHQIITDFSVITYNENIQNLTGFRRNGEEVTKTVAVEDLKDYIGEDAAKQLMTQPVGEGGYRRLETENIVFGGEKMRWFYDRNLINMARKYLRKWGVELEESHIPNKEMDEYWIEDLYGQKIEGVGATTPERAWEILKEYLAVELVPFKQEEYRLVKKPQNGETAYIFDITPEMRSSVMGGQPLFQRGRTRIQAVTDPDAEHGGMKIVANVYYDDALIAYQPERMDFGQWQDGDPQQFRVLGLDVHDPNIWVIERADGGIERMPRDTQPGMVNAANAPLETSQGLEPEPPSLDMQIQGYRQFLKPTMDALERHMTGSNANAKQQLLGQQLDENTRRQLDAYMQNVYRDLGSTKNAAMTIGEQSRDLALLNYTQRTGFDNLLGVIFPYQYWYTRSALNWLRRAVDRPSMLTNYARLRALVTMYQDQEDGYPTRLKGKVKIPFPFLPDGAGDGIYVDPWRKLFPWVNYFNPVNSLAQDQNKIEKRAATILRELASTGQGDSVSIENAITTKTGDIWEKALEQARTETDVELDNPFDILTTAMSPSLPLNWMYQLAMGRPDRISKLPTTKAIQNLTALAGIGGPGGWDVEAGLRNAIGLPSGDRWEDYRIDRELANMAAMGDITPDEAIQAMIDRTGPTYDQAKTRVGKQQGIRYLFSWLSADLFPEGEKRQREIGEKFGEAYDQLEAGDKDALRNFFDQYPEYEARLASWKDPEQRLRGYLTSIIWDAWQNLNSMERKAVKEQFGEEFDRSFINKDTRAYDAISTKTLALWANSLADQAPSVKEAESAGRIQLQMPDKDVSAAVEEYYNQREQQFPGIGDLQTLYYSLTNDWQKAQFAKKYPQIREYSAWRNKYLAEHPTIIAEVQGEDNELAGLPQDVLAAVYQYRAARDTLFPGIMDTQDRYFDLGKNDRKQYLKDHPELSEYWTWRREFAATFPKAAPYILSDETLAAAILGESGSSNYSSGGGGGYTFAQANSTKSREPYLTASEWREFSPALIRQLIALIYRGEPLMSGAAKELERIWDKIGKPGGDIDTFVEMYVKPMLK